MSTYLLVTRGREPDVRYSLDKTQDNKMGRGLECQVQLNDPLSSRVHAKLFFKESQWHVSDAGSRNGTLLNGSKIDVAILANGNKIRIGNTELEFVDDTINEDLTIERINLSHDFRGDKLGAVADGTASGMSAFLSLRKAGRSEDLSDLHQLSIRCITLSTPEQVSKLAIDVLRNRTQATFVALLFADNDGKLIVQRKYPNTNDGRALLSDKLTEMVCKQATAVWVKNETRQIGDTPLRHFADAICVPLLNEGKTIGVIHLYREKEVFEKHSFDFTIAAASFIAASLVRARNESSLRNKHERLQDKNADFDELLGESQPMVELKERIVRVAKASGSILVRGESGSGKELVARAIHRASMRADHPMLSVNCAAMPSELMESQLFGHVKGAFTGADKDHVGWFQQAHGGTLFLDEIGEMTLAGQAKLLRILEGHPFLPVGGRKEVRVDVRVITATNRDLSEFVSDKRFREDLYYRLSVFEIIVPPLRQRGVDIGLLIDHFLEHFGRQHGRMQLKLSAAARKRMLEYSWPGNVRQLRNLIDSAVVLATGDEIRATDITLHESKTEIYDTLNIEQWEQRLIQEALRRTKANMPEAADLLGISRATLYRKLETFGLNKDDFS
ncbi:MAG: sigma 54-interacting transcriptional regulator [Planctomycetota bacterium]|nr:sigma 54-interacting transcriptional regulator [Planctomycetota bacterium]